tara:strand:+ start:246 stop:476 length:231 start_codon:yes stop_codon:yes gene_type:complete
MKPMKMVAFYIIYSRLLVIKSSGLFRISVRILNDFIINDLVFDIYSNKATKAYESGITGVTNNITFNTFSKFIDAN